MRHPAFFSRNYDETMDMMVEARNYMSHVERRERLRAGPEIGLRMSCEALRVTTRLTQVMAWLLLQRAVHQGEIPGDEAMAEPNRLSGTDVCLDESFAEDLDLPKGLRSLLGRSLQLYLRISRLEAQMLRRMERQADSSEPATGVFSHGV